MPEIPVTITLHGDQWLSLLEMVRQSIVHCVVPEGWSPAEYGATKAGAIEAYSSLLSQPDEARTIALFSWEVLQGELARLRQHDPSREDVFAVFSAIYNALDRDPLASRVRQLVRQYETAQAESVRLDLQAHQMATEMASRKEECRKQMADLATRLVRADPSGPIQEVR